MSRVAIYLSAAMSSAYRAPYTYIYTHTESAEQNRETDAAILATTQRRQRIHHPNQNAQPSPLLRALHAPAPLPRRPREPNRRPHQHPPHHGFNLRLRLPAALDPQQRAQQPEHGNGDRNARTVRRSVGPALRSATPALPDDAPRRPRARNVGHPAQNA